MKKPETAQSHNIQLTGSIKLPPKKTVQIFKVADTELLQQYSEFLEKNGYLDTDWREEKPTAIDRFLKQWKEKK